MILKFIILLLLASVEGSSFMDNEKNCCVIKDRVECICQSTERFVFSTANVNLKNVSTVVVAGCSEVVLPLNSLTHQILKSVVFDDIERMVINPFALYTVTSIEALFFTNIAELRIYSNSLTGNFRINNLVMRNVTSEILPSGSIASIQDLDLFLITECRFHEVEENALYLTNLSKFEISETEIQYLSDGAFSVMNAEFVHFLSNSFNETENNTFNFVFIDEVKFYDNKLGIIHSGSFFIDRLAVMNFSYNTISELKSRAFWGDVGSDLFIFANNVIESVENRSLVPIMTTVFPRMLNITYSNNVVSCDCNISWLLVDFEAQDYDFNLTNNWCLQNQSINLSELTVLFDVNQTCLAVGPKSINSEDYGYMKSMATISKVGVINLAFQLIGIYILFKF